LQYRKFFKNQQPFYFLKVESEISAKVFYTYFTPF